jgi:hypothetical protein
MGIILGVVIAIIGSLIITFRNGIKDMKSKEPYLVAVGFAAIAAVVLIIIFITVILVTR